MQAQISPQKNAKRASAQTILASYEPHITSSPGTRGGKPRIVGRRITVADIATWYLQQNQSVDNIVRDYDLTHAQVHAALTYYYDHRLEIDTREAEDLAEVEALKQRYPSKLHARLAHRG